MQISHQNQTTEFKNSDVCIVTKYPLHDDLIDFVVVKISGRYPDSHRVVNEICKEIVYIHEGNGRVVVEGKEYGLNPGDLVLIEAGEKFFWEGTMSLFISCRPAFTLEQHKKVD